MIVALYITHGTPPSLHLDLLSLKDDVSNFTIDGALPSAPISYRPLLAQMRKIPPSCPIRSSGSSASKVQDIIPQEPCTFSATDNIASSSLTTCVIPFILPNFLPLDSQTPTSRNSSLSFPSILDWICSLLFAIRCASWNNATSVLHALNNTASNPCGVPLKQGEQLPIPRIVVRALGVLLLSSLGCSQKRAGGGAMPTDQFHGEAGGSIDECTRLRIHLLMGARDNFLLGPFCLLVAILGRLYQQMQGKV